MYPTFVSGPAMFSSIPSPGPEVAEQQHTKEVLQDLRGSLGESDVGQLT